MIKIKRPVLIFAIGFLIGIIYGLYFEKSIAFIIGIFLILYYLFLMKYKCPYLLNMQRYLKVILSKTMIILFCISAIISNTYLIYSKKKYTNFYNNTLNKIKITAVVISEKKEKEYVYKYVVKGKIGEYKNKRFILYLKKDEKNILKYGDLINIQGEYSIPSSARNYKGFDYSNFLKSKRIYGSITGNKIEIIKNNAVNILFIESNNIRKQIEKQINSLLNNETRGLLIGLILGDKEGITEETIESFRKSNLSHVLAVSGTHTSYLIFRNNIYFE